MLFRKFIILFILVVVVVVVVVVFVVVSGATARDNPTTSAVQLRAHHTKTNTDSPPKTQEFEPDVCHR